jgi:hypothetical protein
MFAVVEGEDTKPNILARRGRRFGNPQWHQFHVEPSL